MQDAFLGETFIRHSQSQKIGKPDKSKNQGAIKPKGLNMRANQRMSPIINYELIFHLLLVPSSIFKTNNQFINFYVVPIFNMLLYVSRYMKEKFEDT